MSEQTTPKSYKAIISKFNELLGNYADVLSAQAMTRAFDRAGYTTANMAQIQNKRVKGINTLPLDYTKEQLGEFLRKPYQSERQLRNVSEGLKWTAYPYAKIIKTSADIPTYRYYVKPLYLDKQKAKSDEFRREAILLDKFNREFCPEKAAHVAAGQALSFGKAFYVPRYSVDKVHNTVNYAFLQQLPEDWCTIIGYNNVSGYTVAFNLMYFMQIGTAYEQFGDLFEPYLDDFNDMFVSPDKKPKKYAYAQHNAVTVPCKGKNIAFYPENIKTDAEGNPKVFMQNGRWMYWVSLPIDKVWTFEVDDTSPAVASPFSGLLMTYAQQSDYEEAQISLLLAPLIKIFTGEIPYFNDNGTTTEDGYKLSEGARLMFETFFDNLMAAHNTGGTAFFSAPVENIKSHDFPQAANANEISETFNKYGMEKAGLPALLPVTDDIKAAQVDASEKIESRFVTATIYPQFCRMMNWIYQSLNLKFEWEFEMFGTIFNEDTLREEARKGIVNGDISQHFVLAALDGVSWLDRLSMMNAVKESGMLDMLIPPVTSYTMKQSENGGLPPQNEGGRPQTEGVSSEAKEKAIDAGISEA